jgi:hypothetical protein
MFADSSCRCDDNRDQRDCFSCLPADRIHTLHHLSVKWCGHATVCHMRVECQPSYITGLTALKCQP